MSAAEGGPEVLTASQIDVVFDLLCEIETAARGSAALEDSIKAACPGLDPVGTLWFTRIYPDAKAILAEDFEWRGSQRHADGEWTTSASSPAGIVQDFAAATEPLAICGLAIDAWLQQRWPNGDVHEDPETGKLAIFPYDADGTRMAPRESWHVRAVDAAEGAA